MFCKCSGKRKDYPLAGWRIIRHEYTPKHYSRIKCLNCGCWWVTRAKYVKQTPNDDGQKKLFNNGSIDRFVPYADRQKA